MFSISEIHTDTKTLNDSAGEEDLRHVLRPLSLACFLVQLVLGLTWIVGPQGEINTRKKGDSKMMHHHQEEVAVKFTCGHLAKSAARNAQGTERAKPGDTG